MPDGSDNPECGSRSSCLVAPRFYLPVPPRAQPGSVSRSQRQTVFFPSLSAFIYVERASLHVCAVSLAYARPLGWESGWVGVGGGRTVPKLQM